MGSMSIITSVTARIFPSENIRTHVTTILHATMRGAFFLPSFVFQIIVKKLCGFIEQSLETIYAELWNYSAELWIHLKQCRAQGPLSIGYREWLEEGFIIRRSSIDTNKQKYSKTFDRSGGSANMFLHTKYGA